MNGWYLEYEFEGEVVEALLFLVLGYLVTEKSLFLELLQVRDMAEWIQNCLENRPTQRQPDDDQHSHVEVVCCCVVIPEVFGGVRAPCKCVPERHSPIIIMHVN